MDTAPPSKIEREVRSVAYGVANVLGVEKCRVRKMGMSYYVDIHVLVDRLATVEAGHKIAHHVKDTIRSSNRMIADVLVHVEPGPNQALEATATR